MADIDVRSPGTDRRSKIQLEDQQHPVTADPRFASPRTVYPNRIELRPARHASVLEIALGILLSLFVILLTVRIFLVPDSQKTQADIIGFYFLFSFIGVGLLALAAIFVFRAIKFFRESKLYVLPNGFPINISTILGDYSGLNPSILDKLGYFDVEQTRAGNPIVAPGEITYTYSPQKTYAPSNMPVNRGEDDTEDEEEEGEETREELLDRLLLKSTDFQTEQISFFDHIDEREIGHIIVGAREDNSILQIPMAKMFNHLVAGSIGSGKSLYLRSLAFQLIMEADQGETPLQLGLADIENNTFPEFRNCRHVNWYASNYIEIERMTAALLKEVERRKLLYEALKSTPKDIERYNVLARREGAEELPMVVIIYDEFSALMHRSQQQHRRILSDILQLALRSRKYGIFLIIAGQTFKADLVDSSVLGQFNFTTAFKVRNTAQSMSILGQPGAERLTRPGEALIKMKDGTVSHIQGLYLDDDSLLDALNEYIDKDKQSRPELVDDIMYFCHEALGDRVRLRELEIHLRSKGATRQDMLTAITWMDEHEYTIRGEKNSRILNPAVIHE